MVQTSRISRFVYICIGMLISITVLFTSCAPDKVLLQKSPTANIHSTNTSLVSVTTGLQGTTDKITQDATSGMSATPPAALAVLQPKWEDILIQAGYQNGMIDTLKQSQTQLTTAETESKSLESQFNTEHAARLKAESSATKALQAKFEWASIACFGALVLAIGVAVSGLGGGTLSTAAYGVAVCSGVGLAISIALIQTVPLIPWIVGGFALICGGLVVYRFFHKNATISAAKANVVVVSAQNQKVNTELVHTIEASKSFMSLKGRRTVFGDGAIPGVTNMIQSPETIDIVSSLRSSMMNLAPSIPETIASDLTHPDTVVEADSQYEVCAQKNDTKSVRARMMSRASMLAAGGVTVVVIH